MIKHSITCSVCKKKLGTTITRLNDLIKKAGSEKALNASYVCRSCKKGSQPAAVPGALPKNKIKCSKCGELVGSPPDRIAKLTREGELGGYTCRSCKKGTTVEGKVKKLTTSRISCSRCGDKFGTTPTRLKRLIGQFGSLEELHTKYVCRKCRKAHNLYKDGRMKPAKRVRRESWVGKPLPDYMVNWRPKNRPEQACSDWKIAAFVPKNKKDTIKSHEIIKEIAQKLLGK